MTHVTDLARYAAIFAADAGTDALYYGERITDDVADLCIIIAREAIRRRKKAFSRGEEFYAMAFVEAAADMLNRWPSSTLVQLIEAGEAEVEAIKGNF